MAAAAAPHMTGNMLSGGTGAGGAGGCIVVWCRSWHGRTTQRRTQCQITRELEESRWLGGMCWILDVISPFSVECFDLGFS
jgi:hypothetical protein